MIGQKLIGSIWHGMLLIHMCACILLFYYFKISVILQWLRSIEKTTDVLFNIISLYLDSRKPKGKPIIKNLGTAKFLFLLNIAIVKLFFSLALFRKIFERNNREFA